MRLVFAGTPAVALPSLLALNASRHEVVAVLTRPDAPAGRGRKMTASPVAAKAAELGIEVLKPTKPSDADFVARLLELDVDACPVVAYGALIPQPVLDIPRHGWLNLHFSLLPRWRGAAPVQHSLMAGDQQLGTSCFRLVKELDAGDIYSSQSEPWQELTAGQWLDRLALSGAQQLLDSLDALEQGIAPTPQPELGLSLAPKITVEQARLDWGRPATQLRNQILGCSPMPGAWCELAEQRLKIFNATLGAAEAALLPGQLAITKRQVFVGTGDGVLELLEVQPAGKRRMNAIDWARNLPTGTVLA